MVRAGFAGDRHASLPGGAEQIDASGGAQMLAMHVRAGRLGQQDVPGDDHVFARRRPSAQAQHGAPVAFVHHAVGHQRVILTMVHDRQVEHPRVLEGPAHQFIVLDAMPVVGDRHHSRLPERADGRQFLPRDGLGDGARDVDIDVPLAMVSLADWPGSRKCTCKSIKPGQTTNPLVSSFTVSGGDSFAASGPMAATWPSRNSTSAWRSTRLAGSMTRPPASNKELMRPELTWAEIDNASAADI